MTIRSKLLLYLLPTFLGFLLLICFFFYFELSRGVILIGAITTLVFLVITVFFIADRITEPVEQLNEAALAIAASNYEVGIDVHGPKEIVELANSLNTMRECLSEHINRMRERSLLRERMYGEYECSLLLQDYMFNHVVDGFSHSHLQIKQISVNYSENPKGILLELKQNEQGLEALFFEAEEPGFEGLYRLNRVASKLLDRNVKQPMIECIWLDNYRKFRYNHTLLARPLIWSVKKGEFVRTEAGKIVDLQDHDIVFFYNSDIAEQFPNEEIYNWLGKVLRHFDEDGLDIVQTMLTNELNFLAKREWSKRNFRIVCCEVRLNE